MGKPVITTKEGILQTIKNRLHDEYGMTERQFNQTTLYYKFNDCYKEIIEEFIDGFIESADDYYNLLMTFYEKEE